MATKNIRLKDSAGNILHPETDKSLVGLGNVTNDAQVKRSEMGVASGVATLDSSGKVPTAQLPSYVDDVVEYASQSNFPVTGEDGKIYVAEDTNKTYRWSGSAYVEISASLALGETSSTAYRGDRGKIAYDHSQTAHAPTTNATTAAAGLMSASDKTKLDGFTQASDYVRRNPEGVTGSSLDGAEISYPDYRSVRLSAWLDDGVHSRVNVGTTGINLFVDDTSDGGTSTTLFVGYNGAFVDGDKIVTQNDLAGFITYEEIT